MANTTQIILSGYGALDTDEVVMPLNFSVAEVQNINLRQGSWSKTITLAGTPNNKNIFGHLYDVNSLDGAYDYNKKTRAQIIQNGAPLLDGYIQLINAKKTSPSLGLPDEQVQFDVLIKDTAADFFKSGMREKLLQDLDFSQWNHIYTLSGITSTSAHTYQDIYKYHLMNRPAGAYKLTDFAPGIFAEPYLRAIFRDAGYTFQWSGKSYDDFCQLILPYNGDSPIIANSASTFIATYTATTAPQQIFNNSYNQLNWNSETDPNNLFNLSTGVYTTNTYGPTQLSISYTYRISMSASSDMIIGNNNFITLQLNNLAYNNLNPIAITNPLAHFSTVPENTFITGGVLQTVVTGLTGCSFTVNSNIGDQIEERIKANIAFVTGFTNPMLTYASGGTVPPSDWPKFYIEFGINPNITTDFIFNTPTPTLGDGMTVNLNDFIPKNYKQSSFFASISSIFHLYVTTSKTKDNELIFQSRDEFYDSGGEDDWTDIIDEKSEITLKYIPDVTNKRIILSYKEDKDRFNTAYKEATGDIFGQFEYVFPSEFVDATKTVGPDMSPTPIVLNSYNLPVPAIDVNNPKNNVRILIDGGDWIDGNWEFEDIYNLVPSVTGGTQAPKYTFSKYPYLGHLDNPYSPTWSSSYGLNQYEFYDKYNYLTNNNLYNKYYKRFLTQIESGKLLTARFKLNEWHIHNLDLRTKIWVFDAWYYINKIVDYNPNAIGQTTLVELITVEDGLDFSTFQETVESVGGHYSYLDNLGTINLGIIDNTIGVGVSGLDILGGNGNVFQDSSVRLRIAGNYNQAGVINGEIYGNDNLVSGRNVFVEGNLNNISGGTVSLRLQGNQNSIDSNTQNINIFGNQNSISYGAQNIGLYNSYNNIIGDNASGITLVNSSNVTVLPGITNVTITNANNIIVSGSNQTITTTSDYWTSGSTGNNSIKANNGTILDATGDYAVATGNGTLAIGVSSFAANDGTIALGDDSFASGQASLAAGIASFVTGNGTESQGNYSSAFGFGSIAYGVASHAEGINTRAVGNYSHAEGSNTSAVTFNSHAEGLYTYASGTGSHAEGSGTTAQGNNSHSEGFLTFAAANSSHAEGILTLASQSAAHAEGYDTLASGVYSHSEGLQTSGTSQAAHAEGFLTLASAPSAHAEGTQSVASGQNSHAGGRGAVARRFGEFARSTNAGGKQWGVVNLNGQTNNGNGGTVELVIESTGPEYFDIAVGETYAIELFVVAKQTGTGSAYLRGEGLIKNEAGTTSLVGTFPMNVINTDGFATTVNVTADNVNDRLAVTVVGPVGPVITVNWFATLKYTLIS